MLVPEAIVNCRRSRKAVTGRRADKANRRYSTRNQNSSSLSHQQTDRSLALPRQQEYCWNSTKSSAADDWNNITCINTVPSQTPLTIINDAQLIIQMKLTIARTCYVPITAHPVKPPLLMEISSGLFVDVILSLSKTLLYG